MRRRIQVLAPVGAVFVGLAVLLVVILVFTGSGANVVAGGAERGAVRSAGAAVAQSGGAVPITTTTTQSDLRAMILADTERAGTAADSERPASDPERPGGQAGGKPDVQPSEDARPEDARPEMGKETPAEPVSPAPTSSTSEPAPVFHSSISRVDKALEKQLRETGTWSEGVPVALKDLRVLSVDYWGFDREVHRGRLLVNQAWAVQLGRVFHKIFEAGFPLRRMDPVDYLGIQGGGGVLASDNTMSFNGRKMRGGSSWSMHAYGLAVDINPVENPYVKGNVTIPGPAKDYVTRSQNKPGMLHDGDIVVEAFESIGWKWGGDWTRPKDYMHFSSNGR